MDVRIIDEGLDDHKWVMKSETHFWNINKNLHLKQNFSQGEKIPHQLYPPMRLTKSSSPLPKSLVPTHDQNCPRFILFIKWSNKKNYIRSATSSSPLHTHKINCSRFLLFI